MAIKIKNKIIKMNKETMIRILDSFINEIKRNIKKVKGEILSIKENFKIQFRNFNARQDHLKNVNAQQQ